MSVPASKHAIQIIASQITNGGTGVGSGVTGYIDTKGFDYVIVDVDMSTSNAATNNPSTLNLMEADVTTSSSFATISGFVGDTDFTIATMSTTAESCFRFALPTKGRKRYLKVAVIPLTTQDIIVSADLSNAEELPITATKAGVNNLVTG